MLNISNIAYQLPITVNADQLRQEVNQYILEPRPDFKSIDRSFGISFSITNLPNTPLDDWFRSHTGAMSSMIDGTTNELLVKNYRKYTIGFPGPWRDNLMAYYKNGTADRDLVHWRNDMLGSEMYALSKRIQDFFKIDYSLRCRASLLWGEFRVNRHSDPHTPWRVHVNLESGPETYWEFYDAETNSSLQWKQPKNTVWLIRTGNIQHSVFVPKNEFREQLFYHIWHRDLGPNYHQIA